VIDQRASPRWITRQKRIEMKAFRQRLYNSLTRTTVEGWIAISPAKKYFKIYTNRGIFFTVFSPLQEDYQGC
jgi:hypothetical protein